MKILYLECNMGAAGDMLMAALYPLLPNQADFLTQMNALGLPGVAITAQSASTHGLAGIHMAVTVAGHEEDDCQNDHHGHDHDHNHHRHDHHHHATPGHIASLIDGLPLDSGVKTQARKVYDAIAAAEATAHGCAIGDVHFHEVGALDAVADVVGVCLALSLLAPDKIVVSPVCTGFGEVKCAHGVVPVPAPATAALLEGVPCYGGDIRGELCTPTGAALLRSFAHAYGSMPAMILKGTGCGVGSRDFGRPNCVRAFLGEDTTDGAGEITELVCNLDDMTPEALAYACARLLELGSLDVYTLPGTMKKGRPGWVLTLLCDPEREGEFVRHIFRETTTNGLRSRRCAKYFLAPRTETVNGLTVKIAQGYGATHRKVEFEDAARIARGEQKPIWEVRP